MVTAAAVRHITPFPIRELATLAVLRYRRYRLYLLGQSLANTGAWIQSIAQDWLVLRLTNSATAVGVTMALQFGPTLLFGLPAGLLADRHSKRRLLLATQSANAVLTGMLSLLTIGGIVRASDVYAFALLSGLVFAIDAPARQAFVGEVVPAVHLRAAVSMNAAVLQSTRLVGPAIAAVLISTVGIGWAFAANAACYLGPTACLLLLRTLTPRPPAPRGPGQVRDTLHYVLARPRVAWSIACVGVVGTFGLNFPVVLTAMASKTFHGSADTYGLFNIVLAIGSITGALLVGAIDHGRLRMIILAGGLFGLAQTAAAYAPDLATFLAPLLMMGLTNVAFQSMANSSVQLWVDPEVRGRVMGLYMLVWVGGTPIGAPLIGAITNTLGARTGMAVCGLVPLITAVGLAVHLRPRPIADAE